MARRDVAGVALERELGRVHADDDQAVAAVARVPGLEVGQRAQAVDARVGPEVDEHDLAAQRLRLSGCPPGVLNQRWLPVKSGAAPRRGSFAPATPSRPVAATAKRDGPRRSSSRLDTACDVSRLCVGLTSAAGRWSAIADWKRTSRFVAIATPVSDEHDRQRALQAGAAPGGAQALDERPAAEREREQDERRAQREGEAHGHRARRGGADGDDRGEDRPRARRVDEAQRGADEQARGEAVAARRAGPGATGAPSGASRRAATGGTAHDDRRSR